MSGPVQDPDLACKDEPLQRVDAREGRSTEVGGLPVARVLPTKGRRTVGAWCFVDLLGPMDAVDPDPLEVGPHPHIGLSTVTWLTEGEALHSDSLGTEQLIRPGQVNLMTAGHGIAHAELAAEPPFRGVQLWLAQPEGTRHGASRFEHHVDLPRLELPTAEAMVFVGALPGAASPVTTDTEVVAADVQLRRGTSVLPTDLRFELAVVPVDGRIKVGEAIVEPGWIGLVPAGVDELPLEVEHDGARALVVGGVPLGERIQMWWNFVARDRDEITDAYRDWAQRTDRFGPVPSDLERIDAPVPPWLTPQA
ncbi:MAG: pirin family protein [Nitriliruptoraceae bacterium]